MICHHLKRLAWWPVDTYWCNVGGLRCLRDMALGRAELTMSMEALTALGAHELGLIKSNVSP